MRIIDFRTFYLPRIAMFTRRNRKTFSQNRRLSEFFFSFTYFILGIEWIEFPKRRRPIRIYSNFGNRGSTAWLNSLAITRHHIQEALQHTPRINRKFLRDLKKFHERLLAFIQFRSRHN